MPGGKFYDKFPAEVIDYEVDCIPALDGGDLVSSAPGAVEVTSDELEILDDPGPPAHQTTTAVDRKSITFWCTGGEAGRVCKVIISIWTELGRYRQLPAYVVIKPL